MGNFLDFSGGFLGGNFFEKLFGGFFGRISLEELFGNFWEDFFERNSL